MAKTLSIIVAVALDNGIGNKNQLLAHLPDDLRHFRSITQGHPVIMGRNTWFSTKTPATKPTKHCNYQH